MNKQTSIDLERAEPLDKPLFMLGSATPEEHALTVRNRRFDY